MTVGGMGFILERLLMMMMMMMMMMIKLLIDKKVLTPHFYQFITVFKCIKKFELCPQALL